MGSQNTQTAQIINNFPRTYFRGIGQVMFQDNAWTGILFLCGIIWGAYASNTPLVAWGAVIGTLISTLTGYFLNLPDQKGAQGLWGFNGVLVGCAFPTFLGDTIWMWIALILCSAMTTWVRTGMDLGLKKYNVSSLTFPFVFSTWLFLLAARVLDGMAPVAMGNPEFDTESLSHLDMSFGNLVLYWLRGISQIFLIDSWVTGIFFLVALAISSWRAALWAAIASAISLFVAIVWHAPATDIAEGLYGFSAVLTGIALGATFCNFSWESTIWCILGIVATVFIQAGMNALVAPFGIPTLTGPFCVATWIFLLPQYKFFLPGK